MPETTGRSSVLGKAESSCPRANGDRREQFALCLIVLVGLVSRLSNLHESLWNDEIWSTHIMLGNVIKLGFQVLYDVHPPLYGGFMYVWIHLFGDSELAVRMPSLVTGCLSILLVYVLGRTLVGRTAALLAAALMALSPVHIWYSQEARQYSPALFLLLLAIVSYYKLLEPVRSRSWYVVYSLAIGGAVLSHYFIAVYLVAISILCLCKPAERVSRPVVIVNVVIGSLLVACVAVKYLFGAVQTGLPYLRSFTVVELWKLFFDWFLLAHSYAGNGIVVRILIGVVQVVFLGLFVAGVSRTLATSRRNGDHVWLAMMLFLFALPACLLGVSLVGFEKVYIERGALVLLPFFLLAVARGIVDSDHRARTVVCSAFAVTVAAVTLTVFNVGGDRWTVTNPKPDWRGAAEYLDRAEERRADAADRSPSVVFVSISPKSLTYYNQRIGEITAPGNGIVARLGQLKRLLGEQNVFARWVSAQVDEYLRDASADVDVEVVAADDAETVYQVVVQRGERGFYLLHDAFWSTAVDRLVRDTIADQRFSRVGVERFKGIEIYRYELAGAVKRRY